MIVEVSLHGGGFVAVSDPAQIRGTDPSGRVVVVVDGVEYLTSWLDPATLDRAIALKVERADAEALRVAQQAEAAAAAVPSDRPAKPELPDGDTASRLAAIAAARRS